MDSTNPPLSSLDTMTSPPTQHFLKLEDLHTASSPSPSFDNDGYDVGDIVLDTDSAPPNIIVQSKPAKKRKSWGQALPEPKTSLPPRKRAKTEDEKEQRRIERIKRNRAAAHNSRERKRQETERYAVALAKAEAELAAYRKLHGPLPPNIILPEVTLSSEWPDDDMKENRYQVLRKTSTTPGPSPLSISQSSPADEVPSPASPPYNPLDIPVDIKEEPMDSTTSSAYPPSFEISESKSLFPQLDLAQHSAAMLCDLQCQSSSPGSANSVSNSWWAALFLFLMSLQFQTCYKTTLLTIWSLSPSRMARLIQVSAHRLASRSTTSSTTPLLFRSMAMAQLKAATSRVPKQGAITALRRSVLVEDSRMKATGAARRLYLLHQQRRVSLKKSKDHDVRKDDENRGV